MVLGCQNHHFETCFFQVAYPLFCIQFCRIKEIGVFLSISPFTSGKGVYTEMKESRQFHLLPDYLLRRWNQTCSHIDFLFKSGIQGKLYVFYIIVFLLLCLSIQGNKREE